MAQIILRQNKKYVGITVPTHDSVYQKSVGLTLKEVRDLFFEYEHIFKKPDSTIVQRIESWICLQVMVAILQERYGWNCNNRRPYTDFEFIQRTIPPTGKTTASEAHPKRDLGDYAQADFYTNPSYGWCD